MSAVDRGEPVALLLSGTNRLLQIRFPATGRVIRHWKDARNRVRFAISGSSHFFNVPAQSPFAAVVADAVSGRRTILVLDPGFDGRPALVQPWNEPETPAGCDRFRLNPGDIPVVTRPRASELYRKVFAQNSERPYTSGVPFRWSYSYCEQKAHAVADILRQERLEPGKAWVFARHRKVLRIRTTSRRSCREEWGFHVGVVLRSDERGSDGFWVFDPTTTLERGVVTLADWAALFGTGRGRIHLTTSRAFEFCRECGADDPCFEPTLGGGMGGTEEGLMIARCALACLAERECHPPHRCRRSA